MNCIETDTVSNMRLSPRRHGRLSRRLTPVLCALLCVASCLLSSCEKETTGDSLAESSSPECDSMAGIDEADASASGVYNAAAINRLTGLPLEDVTLHNHRPIAVMINNINVACPQEGISLAEVMYECTVEGGITRMMMLVNDYEKLPTVGSVRSCREYYLDFASNHNAIYAHIGGSEEAYTNIYNRQPDELDGLRGDNFYFRDPERRANMGMEHSAMANGELLQAAVEKRGFDTSMSDDTDTSFSFIPYTQEQNATASGGKAEKVIIPYTGVHQPRYEYDSETNKYRRWQFIDWAHIDGTTGEQIAFTNVLVIACPHELRNDEKNHINVYTVGSGDGLFISGGRYIKIRWSKDGVDEPLHLFREDGSPLLMNCGTTFVNIVAPQTMAAMTIE